jgi:hypothetical protein
MTDFEQGFRDELAKLAAMGATPLGKPKGEQPMKGMAPGAGKTKPLATAMRAPLSLVTAMKPPEQTFYKGK